jgi:FkbM family methyltransferase
MFTDIFSMVDFLKIQDDLKPTMSIEVGAYDADFSVQMSKRINSVYAFEASKPVFDRYVDVLAREASKVKYINKAITNYEGQVEIRFDKTSNPADVGHNGIKSGRYEISHSNMVDCTSLDIYFKDIKNENICLWIDCEGANREVLAGSERILSLCSSVYIEVEDKPLWDDIWLIDDVMRFMADKGFTYKAGYGYAPNQYNLIFVKPVYK